jgi:hypothetical protein
MNNVYEHVGYDWTKKRRLYRRRHEGGG